jgi:hypothetical protein
MNTRSSSFLVSASLTALGLLVLAPGCSDDSNSNPKPDPTIPIDTGGKSGNSGGSGNKAGSSSTGDGGAPTPENGGTSSVDGGAPPVENQAGDGQGGAPVVVPPPACDLPERGEDGCYNCPKDRETVQWLNRCVPSSKGVPFDNEKRVPLLKSVAVDPSLPPLPN